MCMIIVHLGILNCGIILCGHHTPSVSSLQIGAKPAFRFQLEDLHEDRRPRWCLSHTHNTRWPRDLTHRPGLSCNVKPRTLLGLWGLLLPIKSVLFKRTRGCCVESRYSLNCHTIICNDSNQIVSYMPFDASFSKEGFKYSDTISFLFLLFYWSSNGLVSQLILLPHSSNNG